VRRLRYALEWLGEHPKKMTALQTSLGEACDCAIALRGEKKDGAFARDLTQRRRAAVHQARKQWYALRPKLQRT
jgi:hypothetical protein